MAANQYEYEDEDEVQDNGPAELRKALKKAQKEREAIEAELNKMRSDMRARQVKDVLASTIICISFPTASRTAIHLSTSSCAFGFPTFSFTPGQPFFLDATAPATNSSVVR